MLQNLLLVKELNLANSFGGISYLGFEKLTFVPIQVHMNVILSFWYVSMDDALQFALVTYIQFASLFLFESSVYATRV